ncbi:MAG: hypothetical protein OXD47_07855 [Gammaproteobacteria bacterium]|nr:hypothetical protein [Gammaproteobacteria bacterium]MCY4281934.1 hypothetical protein [Gammaproteobacteria bacterium]MCY4338696.1 hypothetical protein [Gammaproteobacteria bacterium]
MESPQISPFELPILIHYRPSRQVAVFNSVLHVGAVCCLFLAQLPLVVSVLITAIILGHYGCYLRRVLGPQQLCLQLDRHERWLLLQAGQEAVELRLLPGALVHPRVVVLCFREPDGRTRSCVLTHDNLDAQTLRRLRVRLRWSK